MNILVVGGAGYIGSHMTYRLNQENHSVVVLDDLSAGFRDAVKGAKLIIGSLADQALLEHIFSEHQFDAVMHFASFIQVGESVRKPADYYRNNVINTLNLLEAMVTHQVKNFVFSSTAAIFGNPEYCPIDEKHRAWPINPYGQTKLAVENILKDLASSSENWRIISLRYFNPVGAHESALIGEMPKGTPNNLMPCLLRVASKEIPYLQVFGNDYPTKDGTAVRDYIHVIDLATGHIKALDYLKQHKGYDCFNLGTGQPYSVLEVVKTFEAVNEIEIPLEIGPKRSGDLPEYYATSDKAKNLMLWHPELSLTQMCKTAWSWKKNLNQML